MVRPFRKKDSDSLVKFSNLENRGKKTAMHLK